MAETIQKLQRQQSQMQTAPQSVVGNGGPPFQVTKEYDAAAQASGKSAQMNYHSITNMPQYAHKSFEELRCENYSKLAGTKEATPAQSATSASTEILVKSVAGPTALKPDSIRDKLGVYVQTAQQYAGRPVYDFVRQEEPLVAPPPVSDPGAAVPNTSTPPNPFAGLPAFLASSSSPPAFSIGNFGVAPGAPAPAAPSPLFAPKKLWFDGSYWRCGPDAHFDEACVLVNGACTLKCMCVRDTAMTADAITSTMWEARHATVQKMDARDRDRLERARRRGGRAASMKSKLPGPEYHQISVRRMAASTNDATAVKVDAAPAVDAELCGRLAHYYVHPGGQVTTYAETTWQSTGSVTWGEAGRVCRVIEQRREYLCICEGERKLWVRGPHAPEAETETKDEDMQGPPPAPALAKEESTYDEGVPDDDDDAVEDDDDDDFENLMQLTSTKPPAIEPCTRNVYELVRPPAPPAVCVAAPSILRLSGLRARPSLNERFARTTEQRAGQPVYASKRAVLSFDPAERAWQIWQLRSGKRELCAVCATGRSVTPFELATKNRSRWRALHAKTKTWADEPTVSLEAVPAFHVSGSILRPELMGYYELVEGQTCAGQPVWRNDSGLFAWCTSSAPSDGAGRSTLDRAALVKQKRAGSASTKLRIGKTVGGDACQVSLSIDDAAFKSQVRSERAFRTEDLVWQFDEVPGFAGRSIKSAPCVAKSSKYRCVQEGDNVVQILSQPDAASKSATETTKAASGTAHFSPGDRVRLRAGISSPRHGVPPGGRSSVGVITQNRSNQDIIIDFDDGTKWQAWSPDYEPADPGTVVLPGEVVCGSLIIGSAGHEYLQVENCRGVPLGFLPMSDASGTRLFAPLGDESGGGAGRSVRDEIVAIFKAKDLSKVSQVDQLLIKYAGKETALLKKVQQKYGAVSAGATGPDGGLFAALTSDASGASRAAPAFGATTLTGQALVLSGASDSPAAYLFGEYGWRMGGSWHCATTGKILWVQDEGLGVISTVANSTTASAVMRLNASPITVGDSIKLRFDVVDRRSLQWQTCEVEVSRKDSQSAVAATR